MKTEERLKRHLDREPVIPDSCWIAPTATIYGDVVLGERCSVWPSAVIRGDINSIRIGDDSNIQDGAVVHLADDFGVRIGRRVTVGHGAIVHACEIGMNATVLDGAKVGANSIIGAHALVTQGMEVPPGSMVLGTPGKIARQLNEEQIADLPNWAIKYVEVSRGFKERGF